MHFETIITQIIPRTADVKSFRFDRPEGLDCNPGQYMLVTIKSEGVELRKPFTISSSPTEKEFLELTKKLTSHPFSKALESLNLEIGIFSNYVSNDPIFGCDRLVFHHNQI
jgi:ferredoxin-NADP reductase